MFRNFLIAVAFLLAADLPAQQTVRYHLHVKDTVVNYTGRNRKAIAINGRLPAPALHFTEGDTAEIVLHNHLRHETSIHWHGLILPNEQDGVPYLTTAPVKPHSTHVYKFHLKQNGTYWYHSHTMLQEQAGMYGAFIIHERKKDTVPEAVLLLSDWSDENPRQIERSLHNATDWYNIKKGAAQDYLDALLHGHAGTRFVNELKRMHAMDVSDVYYERFLVNGATEERLGVEPGGKMRLRVINGSSSTYFWLQYAEAGITVIAADGEYVVPVAVDRLIIGVSETYDLLVEIPPEGMAYEFRATSEDRTGAASAWVGEGTPQYAEKLGRLNYFEGMKMMNGMMGMNGAMKMPGMDMGLQKMDMNAVMYPETKPAQAAHNGHHAHHTGGRGPVTLNYTMLKALRDERDLTETGSSAPVRTFTFELTGNMNRYAWSVNHKTVSESAKILIRKGERTRIVLVNNSMMRHPMHLHGHYFRVLNGQGESSPLKNVIDVMPMETDAIEFFNHAYGDWYFHCHILYHMMSGMGRIFSYENSPPNPQIADPERALKKVYADDRRFYSSAEISLESNGSDGEIAFGNTRWLLQTEWRIGLDAGRGYEWESHIGRYLGRQQFLLAYGGWDYRWRTAEQPAANLFGQVNTKDQRGVACLGIIYLLPWFVSADLRLDHSGNFRIQVGRQDLPLTARLRGWVMVNTDREFRGGLWYILTKYFSLAAHYDSDMGFGAGVKITY